jgi:hypothetical protein
VIGVGRFNTPAVPASPSDNASHPSGQLRLEDGRSPFTLGPTGCGFGGSLAGGGRIVCKYGQA